MALGANQHINSGFVVKAPEVDVIPNGEDKAARTVVVIDIWYYHPYDTKKFWKNRRKQFMRIRVYGKSAEAASKKPHPRLLGFFSPTPPATTM